MHLALKTLLNKVEQLNGFIYDSSWIEVADTGPKLGLPGQRASVAIRLRPHAYKPARCSQCEKPAPGYDRLPERRFEFVPLWGIKSFFLYAPRRLECHDCGIHVEHLPWALESCRCKSETPRNQSQG